MLAQLAFRTLCPTNGTLAVTFKNLDFAGWPLPMDCDFQVNYNGLTGNCSTKFTLFNDTNIPPKAWGLEESISSSTSSSSATTTPTLALAPSIITVIPSNALTGPVDDPHTAAPGGSAELSTGAKAGIAIGCITGAIIGIALFFIIMGQRRRNT